MVKCTERTERTGGVSTSEVIRRIAARADEFAPKLQAAKAAPKTKSGTSGGGGCSSKRHHAISLDSFFFEEDRFTSA